MMNGLLEPEFWARIQAGDPEAARAGAQAGARIPMDGLVRVEHRTIWFWQAKRYLSDGWQLNRQCFVWGRMIEALLSHIWPHAMRVRSELPNMKPGDAVTLYLHGREYVGTVK